MNDNELITTMKESFTGVHSATPVERIVSRSRTVRARRRIRGMAGTAAAVAGAALAGTALLPASHPGGAQLAAYTVTKQASGTIEVTIRELRDPAGLQQTLRADGVPASVTFISQPNQSCRNYPKGAPSGYAGHLLGEVIHDNPSDLHHGAPLVLFIHPSALPRDAGVYLGYDDALPVPGSSNTAGRVVIPNRLPVEMEWLVPGSPAAVVTGGLVQASPQCTGLPGNVNG